MQKIGRVLRLREGAEKEYERYHAQVWPEVLAAIERAGIRNHTIFRYDRWLFAYFEITDGISLEDVGREISKCRISRDWEEKMHTLQERLPESPEGDSWWVNMKKVFNS